MSFEDALRNTEPGADASTAVRAHHGVREVLTGDTQLQEWGIDPVLIGSYRRNVAIRRVKDVDVFCRLNLLPLGITGVDALREFRRVLSPRFTVTEQARSLSLESEDWGDLHIDVVPARMGKRYPEIPDKQDPATGWQETNPEELTELTSARNRELDERYVPLIKLMRQTRRAMGIKRPGGLYMEMALYEAYNRGDVTGDTYFELYINGLRGVATVTEDLVLEGRPLPDPTRPGEHLSFRATEHEWRAALIDFDDAASQAEATRRQERCQVAATFRRLLGRNGDDLWVYPLPDDCNEDGTTKSLIVVGDRSGSRAPQRFA